MSEQYLSEATSRILTTARDEAVTLIAGLVRRSFEGETADQIAGGVIANAHTTADHFGLSADDPDRADLVDFARDAARLATEPRIQDLFRGAYQDA